MKYHELPNGDSIPALGLGTWKSAGGETSAAVKEAIRIGYRHIDCAPTYFNEREIGEALKEALVEGEVNRSDLWITSPTYWITRSSTKSPKSRASRPHRH